MICKRISVEGFRNIETAEVEFCDGVNILIGNNAQGKTNLLEALYLFSMGKSFRTHLDTELIRFGEDYLKAELLFCDRNREHTLEIIILREKKKQPTVMQRVTLLKHFFP